MKRPTLRALPFLLPVALASCGGGGGPLSDVGDSMSQALSCTFRNCTESSTLRTDEISMRFTAEQAAGENRVKVSGFVSKSANLFTTVLLQPGEKLSASVDGGTETTLGNPDGKRLDYEVSLSNSAAEPQVQLVFTRDGVRHVSRAVLPPPFVVAEPTGTPLLARSATSLTVKLSPAPTANAPAASMQGRCTRKDGSSFDLQRRELGTRAGKPAGTFYIDTVTLDQELNAASQGANNNLPGTSLVSRCELTLTWTTSNAGTAPATLNAYSTFSASRTANHAIVYDAWL